ncbi:MAG TPA: hypothetical protein VFH31_20735 [Pyrinomonadaceae bacterium]|nr:hypothetical protein [Pyrinomonadaceae bacterium]
MELRTGGIYSLPNGRELVALNKPSTPRALFRLSGWNSFELCEYIVTLDGRLACQGRLTAWDITSLSDTGRTADEIIAH